MMTNDYPYLPAHLVQYKDGGLQLTREEATQSESTGSILILGTATDGPVGEPVKVDSQTYELFGKSVNDDGVPNGATLTTAFEEAYKFGCRDTRLMRISGAPATASIKGPERVINVIKYVEQFLGTGQGNTASKSYFSLDEDADEVIDVSANGIKLYADRDQFTAITKTTERTTWTDTYGDEYDENKVCEAYVWETLDSVGDDAAYYLYLDGSDWKEFYTDRPADSIGCRKVTVQVPNPEYDSGDPLSEEFIDEDQYILTEPASDFALTADRLNIAYNSELGKVIAVTSATTQAEMIEAVELADGVCSAGAYVLLKLRIGNEISTISGNADGLYIAGADPWTYTLENTPTDIDSVSLYINNTEYTKRDKVAGMADTPVFGLLGKVLTINPGRHVPLRARIDVRYKTSTPDPDRNRAEFTVKTAFGGDIYNESLYTVIKSNVNANEKIFSLEKPETKKSQAIESPMIFSSFEYPTYGLLVNAINAHPRNGGLFIAAVDKVFENESVFKLEETGPEGKFFAGGEDGIHLSKQEIFDKLAGKRDEDGYLVEEGVYQLLENYSVDNIVLADGIYADDELQGRWQNFAQELALFCAVCSFRNHQTHGFIATSSPLTAGLKDVRDHIQKLANFSNIYIMREQDGTPILDSEKKEIDLGKFVTVIAGPELILSSPRLGPYATNSAAAFAGFISTLPANVFATNKVMSSAMGLKARFSNSQLNTLSMRRYASYKYKDDGVTVAIVDAPTSAKAASDYTRLSTVCAVRAVINDLRTTADPFLGQPNTVQSRNALSSALDKVLLQHKDAGSIQDYSFVVVASAMDELLGRAQVELTIVPAQELRQLTTIVSLRPAV